MIEVFDSIGEAGDWLASALDDELQGWLVTVDADGTPQPSTVWFLRDGESILVYSMPAQRKLDNIAERPRVAFHLNSDRQGEKWAVVVGEAALEPRLPLFTEVPAFMGKYLEPLEHWGMEPQPTAEAYSVAIRITPSHVRVRYR